MRYTPRFIATFGLAVYVYAELAAHVYPFVLLPHLGIPLRIMALTLFAVLHAATNFGWRAGLLMFFATTLMTWSFEQIGVVTGAVYGAYHYSGMLGPKIGAVPLLIPPAWFMMIYPILSGRKPDSGWPGSSPKNGPQRPLHACGRGRHGNDGLGRGDRSRDGARRLLAVGTRRFLLRSASAKFRGLAHHNFRGLCGVWFAPAMAQADSPSTA